jgi:phosphoribosylanthranilate isomerase
VVRVKICGLNRIQDAELAAEIGADALGFVFEPSSPRCVSDKVLDWIERLLPPWPLRVAVFGIERKIEMARAFDGVQAVELTGENPTRQRLQVYRLGQQVSPEARPDAVAEACAAAERADLLVLDAAAGPGVYGGTGKMVDWSLAAEIIQSVPRPVALAGGLTPDNVAEAIQTVKPYAVDVSSGVEASTGIKDPVKIRDFIQAARQAGR